MHTPVARPVAPVVRDRLIANISMHTPVALPGEQAVAPVVRDRLIANISMHTPVARPGEQAGSGDPALQRLDEHACCAASGPCSSRSPDREHLDAHFQLPVSFFLDLQLTLD